MLPLLIVGLTLGTAWAVRGQFGHEQGAAWAGAIGGLSILVIARRRDWNANLFGITLAGAIGWGLGGMMSYGLLVGYGHSLELRTTWYGLAMVAVVGALHGFLGGGLFGLALGHSKKAAVPWWRLSAAMIVGGLTGYQIVINWLGWRMTAPRSEAWAICFGMALVVGGYAAIESRRAALRVAIFSALGAGFGFAFGNVLHRIGLQSGIGFNFWNVMEYSIGFFGGIGMAWGTFTAQWPERKSETTHWTRQILAMALLTLLIPMRVWAASFSTEKLSSAFEPIGSVVYVEWVRYIALLAVVLFASWQGRRLFRARANEVALGRPDVRRFFFGYFIFYILLSLGVTGSFFSSHRIEQYLYLLNFAVVGWLLGLLLLRRRADADRAGDR